MLGPAPLVAPAPLAAPAPVVAPAPVAAPPVGDVPPVAPPVDGVTTGGSTPEVNPLLDAGGAPTGAIGVVDNSAAGSAGGRTAVVPAPEAALGVIDVEGALGACAPPDAFVDNVALGAPGHGGHDVDSGAGPAGNTPAVLVDDPAAEVAPDATGTPRIAPVPLVCARPATGHKINTTVKLQRRNVIHASGACAVPIGSAATERRRALPSRASVASRRPARSRGRRRGRARRC